jgi:hypothetical protein
MVAGICDGDLAYQPEFMGCISLWSAAERWQLRQGDRSINCGCVAMG